jgi:hypothetical protein
MSPCLAIDFVISSGLQSWTGDESVTDRVEWAAKPGLRESVRGENFTGDRLNVGGAMLSGAAWRVSARSRFRIFRGIKELVWLPSAGINCLVGPGDSGKSSMLDAIDSCVGARRNIQFTDADFHGLDVDQPIQISVTIGDLDDALKNMDVYGLYVDQRDAARAGRGIWKGSYVGPWLYRACIRANGRPQACSDDANAHP